MKNVDIVFYDGEESSFVGLTWRLGAFFFGWYFDQVLRVSSWEEVLVAIEKARAADPDDYVRAQYWGHGRSGEPLIAGKKANPDDDRWGLCDEIWFRCCYVAMGEKGKAFMTTLAKKGVAVAAHIDLIGTWGVQSMLVGIRPPGKAWWHSEIQGRKSTPLRPKTVSALTMRLPAWAWEPSAKLRLNP